jgi:hypothetical protein
MKQTLIFAMIGMIGLPTTATQAAPSLISVRKISDRAPHSAFTDLIYWNEMFVCAFREGRAHVSSDGKIRVLTSDYGDTWSPAALLELEGYDLRDAGLSATPDGRLMLIGGAAPRKEDSGDAPTGAFVSFSSDGTNWTKPKIVSEPGMWLWRVTWQDDRAYGVSYPAGAKTEWTRLVASNDGAHFEDVVAQLYADGRPTEATLRTAQDGTMYCLQRRDGEPRPKSALLGVGKPPYTEWKWNDLGIHLGGPNFLQLPSGRWIAAGRIYEDNKPYTQLAWLDVAANKLEPILKFPSGGDSSYPGLVYRDGMLWVSYYSSHEGKTSIYLARVKVE